MVNFDRLSTENVYAREFLAEFLGTFFLMLIGCSANIQSATTTGYYGLTLTTQIAWGIGVAFGIFLAANISGAHLNPAISLVAVLNGDLKSSQLALYVIAQLIGAFCGSAIAFVGHMDDINQIYELNFNQTIVIQQLFVTNPSSHISRVGSFFDQFIGTAILSGIISMIMDSRLRIPSGVKPLLVGLTISLISMTFGSNGGFALNPARDLAPRLFLLCIGYGWNIFSVYNYYFWIPIVGPLIGAIVGSWIYKIFVGIHGLNAKIDIMGANYPINDTDFKVGIYNNQ